MRANGPGVKIYINNGLDKSKLWQLWNKTNPLNYIINIRNIKTFIKYITKKNATQTLGGTFNQINIYENEYQK